MALTLYTYYRSSAAYRVRIALNLKGVSAAHRAIHLVKDGGQQKSEAFTRINPNRTVPAWWQATPYTLVFVLFFLIPLGLV
ncbi:MAG TPA: glutathione S-transferase N-terminal domain-containing protein, partial [Rhabdaerophilum sp.]|nr:glutathione S-transferase N-terminal domain-containing protein [Rhabdaerophilum sp.]